MDAYDRMLLSAAGGFSTSVALTEMPMEQTQQFPSPVLISMPAGVPANQDIKSLCPCACANLYGLLGSAVCPVTLI